jgi:hypothetical protein
VFGIAPFEKTKERKSKGKDSFFFSLMKRSKNQD